MNKRIVFLLVLSFVLGICLTLVIIKLSSPISNDYILMNGNRVEIQGGISYINLAKLEKELEYTPGYNKDVTIIIMKDKLVTSDGQTIKGMYRDGVIYINSAFADDSVLHEIGHVVDEKRGCISDSEEFLNIYNSIDHKNYHTNSAEEYFAESYKEYVKGTLQNQELVELFDSKLNK